MQMDAVPNVAEIPIEKLQPSKTNPRKQHDNGSLDQLAETIRQHGVIEPIIVRLSTTGYEIVAGERRYRASKIAGLKTVPAIIRKLNDIEILEVQQIENLQRRDLHPMDEARGYSDLMTRHQYTVEKIAERIAGDSSARSAHYVYNRLKLLNLTKEAQAAFLAGEFTAGHATLLAHLKPQDQTRAMDKRTGGLFRPELTLWSPSDKGPAKESFKPTTVREFQGWIDQHVKLDPKAADPRLFPEVAKVIASDEKELRIVPITHDHYIKLDARDGKRVWGPRSWKRADKSCEVSAVTRGIIVVGPDRGQTFPVCDDKKGCKVHWGAEQREAKARAKSNAGNSGATQEAKRLEEKRKAEYQREELERRRWEKAIPKILEAVAAAVTKAPTKGAGGLASLILRRCESGLRVSWPKYMPKPKTADDVVRVAAFLVLACQATTWQGAAQFPKVARSIGIDTRKIVDAAAPLDKMAPSAEAEKA